MADDELLDCGVLVLPVPDEGDWAVVAFEGAQVAAADTDALQKIASEVFLATGAVRLMREAGLTPPAEANKTFSIMGKPFDPAEPEAYLAGFKIRRT